MTTLHCNDYRLSCENLSDFLSHIPNLEDFEYNGEENPVIEEALRVIGDTMSRLIRTLRDFAQSSLKKINLETVTLPGRDVEDEEHEESQLYDMRELINFTNLHKISVSADMFIKRDGETWMAIRLVNLLPASVERLMVNGKYDIFGLPGVSQVLFASILEQKKDRVPHLKMIIFSIFLPSDSEGAQKQITKLDTDTTIRCERAEIVVRVTDKAWEYEKMFDILTGDEDECE